MALELPAHPNLTQLKKQARDLKTAVNAGDPAAIVRVDAVLPRPEGGTVSLRDAQLVIAREHGFEGWHALSVEVGRRMVDEGDLHRWFGVELNNSVWDDIDSSTVDASSPLEDRERLLYSAYASAYHWSRVGQPANRARAEHLIARTAIQVGMGDLALRHAKRCLELVQSHPDEMEDWDLAFALEALARAQAATGDTAAARSTLDRGRQITAAVVDPDDRAVVEAQFDAGPWFGLTDR
jgi:hypothetical protein